MATLEQFRASIASGYSVCIMESTSPHLNNGPMVFESIHALQDALEYERILQAPDQMSSVKFYISTHDGKVTYNGEIELSLAHSVDVFAHMLDCVAADLKMLAHAPKFMNAEKLTVMKVQVLERKLLIACLGAHESSMKIRKLEAEIAEQKTAKAEANEAAEAFLAEPFPFEV